jgi:hypothetical protein
VSRRRKRQGVRSAIAVVIALALLAGAAYLGDGFVRSQIETRVETAVLEQLPELDADLEAEVGGRFATPQLISGALETLTLTTPAATIDGLTIEDVVVTVSGVPIRGSGVIDSVHATGTVPVATVLTALQRRLDLPDGVELRLLDGEIAAVATIMGVELAAYVVLVPAPRTIGIDVDRLELGGVTVSASDIPIDLSALLGTVAVDLEMLPEGIELTELVVTAAGIDLVLAGTDVSL